MSVQRKLIHSIGNKINSHYKFWTEKLKDIKLEINTNSSTKADSICFSRRIERSPGRVNTGI